MRCAGPRAGAALVALAVLAAGCASNRVHLDPLTEVAPVDALVTDTTPTPAATVFLVGDGGELTPRDRLVPVLAEEVRAAAAALGAGRVATVLLGDNLYPRGLAAGDDLEAPDAEPLRVQLRAVGAAPVYAVLGNHDWNHTRVGGRARALAQVEAVETWAAGQGVEAAVLPGRHCPWPVARDLGDHFRLVFLDTQWWLHGRDRSGAYCGGSPRDPQMAGLLARRLGALVGGAGDRHVLVLAHHPLASAGNHGSRFSARQHLFGLTDVHPALWLPTPGVASLVHWAKPWFTSQDLRSEDYRALRRWAEAALAGRRVLAWAAGHEHGLQVIRGTGPIAYHLVSGSASPEKWTPLGVLPDTLQAVPRNGFLRLDASEGGAVQVTVTYLEDDRVERARRPLPIPAPPHRNAVSRKETP